MIAGVKSDSTPGGKHFELLKVVMVGTVTASTWQEGINLIYVNQSSWSVVSFMSDDLNHP